MRILFVSDTYYPHLNGVYYFVCRLAPLLKEKGHEVAVIVPSQTIHSTKTVMDNIDVYGIPSLPVIFYPDFRVPIPVGMRGRIRRLLRNLKPDIIHIQDHFIITRKLVKVARKLQIPLLGTNHFMAENITVFFKSPRWKHQLEKMIWSAFSKVFNQMVLVTTPTETAARLIRPKLQVEVIAISSGIDLEKFNPTGDAGNLREKYSIPNKPILLYVGRLDPEKNLDEILQAIALAVKKIDFYFVIVGKGIKKASLERLARGLGIADRVIFTGFIPEEDLPYFYKLSRCFIIASIAELLSLATLQAMASGLPIIAVNAGALGELVRDRINGYLFNSGDIQAINQCIYDIFTKDDLSRQMGEKSLEFITKHDIHQSANSFDEIYRRHFENKTPGGRPLKEGLGS